MKKLLVPILLALAYFGTSVKGNDKVDNLVAELLGRARDWVGKAVGGPDSILVRVPQGQFIEVAFSPDKGSESLVLKAINASHSSIIVAAYSFTSSRIAQALLEAKKRGVDVRIVLNEKGNLAKPSIAALDLLSNAGIPMRIISRYATYHDKYMVIDRRTVQTGSFSDSSAAARLNNGNIMVIWNNVDLAQAYSRQWQSRFNQGIPYKPSN
jgi:phosphatidylserine/phosphatidylglycerophosphate/cardiolipin synthase-like enzyme